jgi:hypothetical protein
MELMEGARFCNQCQKPVIDFIDFTENQILDYFLKNPAPVCGRVKNLKKGFNFEYLDSKPIKNLKFTPVAATLLTLTTLTVNAEKKIELSSKLFQTQTTQKILQPQTLTDSILISGIIKDFTGAPIENAEIDFDEMKTFSDKSGFFKFVIPPVLNKPAILKFSYGNLIREVRNYNPVMGSTRFDVVLYQRHGHSRISMGIMMPEYHLPDSLSKLSIKFTDKLDSKTKVFLEKLAFSMKDHPELNIILTSYYKTNKTKATKFIDNVKNFLVMEMGISPERILLNKAELQKQNRSELTIEFTLAAIL